MSEPYSTATGGPWPADQPAAPLVDVDQLRHARVTVHTIDCGLDPCTCDLGQRPIPGQTVHMDTPPARADYADFREEQD